MEISIFGPQLRGQHGSKNVTLLGPPPTFLAYLTSSRNFYQHGGQLGAIWDPTWSDFGAQLGFNLTGFPPTCNGPSTSALPSSQSLLLYSLIYLVAVLVDVPRPLTRDDTTTSTWCDNHGGLPVHNFVHWSLHPRPFVPLYSHLIYP